MSPSRVRTGVLELSLLTFKDADFKDQETTREGSQVKTPEKRDLTEDQKCQRLHPVLFWNVLSNQIEERKAVFQAPSVNQQDLLNKYYVSNSLRYDLRGTIV